jgi:hypothetical protein
MIEMKKPLFQMGRLLSTPAALEAHERAGQSVWEFFALHSKGQWGDELCQEDKDLNDAALVDGSRLLSCYRTKLNDRIYVITEAEDDEGQRVATTALLTSEY